MSDVTEVKELIEKQNQLFEGEFKTELKKISDSGVKTSEGLEKMQDEFDKIQDNLVKNEKRKNTDAKLAQIGINPEAEKDCRKLLDGLIAVAKGDKEAYSSMSKKDLSQFNERDDASGGVTVLPTLDSMIGLLIRQFSTFRNWTSNVTIGTDKWEQLVRKQTNGALRRSKMSNFDDATKSDKFGRISIMVDDLFSIVPFSDNLVMDSAFSIVSDILRSAAEDFAITEASEFISNDTGEGLKGILTYDDDVSTSGNSFDKIQRITTAAASVFTFDDLFDQIYSLNFAYTPNALLGMHRLSMRECRKLKDTQNRYLWEFSQQVGQPATIAGYPVVEMPELAAPDSSGLFTTGDEPIIFGDLRAAYQVVDRIGIVTTRDPYTQYPDVVFKLKKRSGGGLKKGEAVKIMKIQ